MRDAAYWREYREKNRERLRITAKNRRIADRDKARLVREKWKKNNPEKIKESQHKYYLKRASNTQMITRGITKNAIRKGFLVPSSCEICGKKEVEAHHLNYNKPYDIQWLCPEHHKAWHRVFSC